MLEPLLMVHTYQVADASSYRSKLTAWFDYVADNHPDVLHHKVYVDEATGRLINMQVHPGPESMEQMMQLFLARVDEWTELIRPDDQQVLVCGEPSGDLVDRMSYGAGPGGLSVCRPLGGFSRLRATVP